MIGRRAFLCMAASVPLSGLAQPAMAGAPPIYAWNGMALGGADPVAYFEGIGPMPGLTTEALQWDGALWLFASAENREAFERNPHAYAPQYGGYCAFAVSRGHVAPTDPEAWTIHAGKLYLNSSKLVRRVWRSAIERNVTLADRHWPEVLR